MNLSRQTTTEIFGKQLTKYYITFQYKNEKPVEQTKNGLEELKEMISFIKSYNGKILEIRNQNLKDVTKRYAK